MRKLLMLIAVLFTSSGISGVANAGALVVIASTSPGIKTGAVIDGRYPISVQPGRAITLVSADGRTLKIAGPYSGAPDPSSGAQRTELLAALSQIVARPAKDTSSAGIMRTGLQATKNPWLIDPADRGRQCVRLDRPLRLWRPMPIGQVQASLQSYSLGTAPVRWDDGNNEAHWPRMLPVREGETYQIKFRKTHRVRNITIHLMPRELRNDASMVVWMYSRGCLRQARTLLDRLQG